MKKTLTTLALLMIMAAPVLAAKIYVDHDKTADFSSYKTYTLGKGTPAASDLTQKKIEAAVRAQLDAEGLTEAKAGQADLVVLIHAVTDKQLKQSGGNVNIGVSKRTSRGSVGVSSGGGPRVKEVKTGNLVIDLIDRESDVLVWQAKGSGTLKGDPQKLEKKLIAGIEEAFAKYPPQ